MANEWCSGGGCCPAIADRGSGRARCIRLGNPFLVRPKPPVEAAGAAPADGLCMLGRVVMPKRTSTCIRDHSSGALTLANRSNNKLLTSVRPFDDVPHVDAHETERVCSAGAYSRRVPGSRRSLSSRDFFSGQQSCAPGWKANRTCIPRYKPRRGVRHTTGPSDRDRPGSPRRKRTSADVGSHAG